MTDRKKKNTAQQLDLSGTRHSGHRAVLHPLSHDDACAGEREEVETREVVGREECFDLTTEAGNIVNKALISS